MSELQFSADRLQQCIDNKTKPVGSLGRLEQLALQVGTVQHSLNPTMETCQLTIFAGDHGITDAGVSAFPSAVTRQMVDNFLQGGAAANVIADTLGVDLRVVDAGVAGDRIDHPKLVNRRVGPGTANFLRDPAMSSDQYEQALSRGQALGAEGGFDALCFGEMGIGNTSAATLIMHKLLSLPIQTLCGRGTGLDDDGLRNKITVLTRAANRTPDFLQPARALIEYGGFEIVMMAGAMLGAWKTKSVVIVDGFIATAAATAAIQIQPAIRERLIFAHRSAEAGHLKVLEALQASPLLDLELRLGEGTGALLAWPILQASISMVNKMASFDSAQVSGRLA